MGNLNCAELGNFNLTFIITPILLKFVFKFGPNKQPMDDSTIEKVTFSDNYEELEN